ncbi:MAG: DNA repair protein RecO [Pseudomonadota bacterium]
MEWQGDGLILNTRRHGENSAIIDVLTREKGRHSGLVRGGRSRTMRPVLQAGNLVHVVWRARLEDHLGAFTVDPHRMVVAGIIEDVHRLAGLTTITTLASLLPEREPHPRIYDASLLLIEHLQDDAIWPAVLVKWEMGLLEELGFGLDLTKCAVSGETEQLTHVSPRTGRAVCAREAEPWRDKLLALPPFVAGSSGTASNAEIVQGLKLTGHFLARHIFEPRGVSAPEQRRRILRWLDRED